MDGPSEYDDGPQHRRHADESDDDERRMQRSDEDDEEHEDIDQDDVEATAAVLQRALLADAQVRAQREARGLDAAGEVPASEPSEGRHVRFADDLEGATRPKATTCEVCNEGPAKYTCPGCRTRTCGLKCVAAHKERTGCNGARDVGEFVPLSKFTSTQLRRDLQFLTDCSRATETARRALPRIAWRYTFRALPPPLHALRDVAKRHGVLCQILSEGMERRRRNTSRYDAKARQIIWHLEARFVSAASVLAAAAAAAVAAPADAAAPATADVDATADANGGGSSNPVEGVPVAPQPPRRSTLVPQPSWDFMVESAWAQERFMLQDILHYCWAMRPMLPRIDHAPSAARPNRRRQREAEAPQGEEATHEAVAVRDDVGVVDAAEQAEINAALHALDAPYVEAAAAAAAAAADLPEGEEATAVAVPEGGTTVVQNEATTVPSVDAGETAPDAEGDVVFVSARKPETDASEAAEQQPVIESVAVLQPSRGAVAAGVNVEADVADPEAKARVTEFFQRCVAACAPAADGDADDFRGYAVFALVERLQDDRVYQRLDPMRTVQEAARQIFFVNEYPVLYVVELPRLAPEAAAPGARGDDLVDWSAMHVVFPPATREHLERMRASLRRGAAQHAVARAHQNADENAEPADPEAAAAAAAARSMFTKPYAELTEEERMRLARLPCKNFLRGRCTKRSAAGAGPGSAPIELAESLAAEAAGEELCPYWHCDAAMLPLCRSMVRDGECPHGPRCSFSHNPDRLREVWVQQPPRFGPYSADARQGRGGMGRGRGGDRGGRGRGRGHF